MPTTQRAIMVAGLAYGDCGKGTVVDFLARACEARAVVRFNGGPQAGHNVVTRDGRHHTFAQFGSGTFIPGVRTLLSRFMLVEPYALFIEAAHLRDIGISDALDRLLIDGRCPVITPCQQAANRIRELARGQCAHGTCGMGVSEAMLDLRDHPELSLHARELRDGKTIARKLRAIRDLKVQQLGDAIASLQHHPDARFSIETLMDASWIPAAVDSYAELARRATICDALAIQRAIAAPGTILFEGAQGALLDETFGFHPHTTWSTTTFANAEALLDECGFEGERVRLGVLRSYFTRHGPGPLVTEDETLRPAAPEPHNLDTGMQGSFRVGAFDVVAARYAVAAAGRIDALAVTHMDRWPALPARVCVRYEAMEAMSPRDAAWFAAEGGLIRDIVPDAKATDAHRERLTQALRRCRPIHAPLEGKPAEAFLDCLARELRVPVALTSWGPRADDKRLHAAGTALGLSTVPRRRIAGS